MRWVAGVLQGHGVSIEISADPIAGGYLSVLLAATLGSKDFKPTNHAGLIEMKILGANPAHRLLNFCEVYLASLIDWRVPSHFEISTLGPRTHKLKCEKISRVFTEWQQRSSHALGSSTVKRASLSAWSMLIVCSYKPMRTAGTKLR